MIAPLRVKICGITQAQQALDIVKLGAHSLGFICVKKSPRFIEAAQIRIIVEALKQVYGDRIRTIGVFADATSEFLHQTLTESGLTGIQLHGSESLDRCAQLRADYPDHELIKAFRIRDAQTLESIAPFSEWVDTYLLDAFHPQALGGTGHLWDWSLLKNHYFAKPWLLAGGLTPDNVQNAITICAPSGIDLSSGVEVSPGVKDLAKVRMLFDAIKS